MTRVILSSPSLFIAPGWLLLSLFVLLLRMHLIMARRTQRHQITVCQCKLRIFIQMLDVMDHCGLPVSAVFMQAIGTFIMCTLQDLPALCAPCRRIIKGFDPTLPVCCDPPYPAACLQLFICICLHFKHCLSKAAYAGSLGSTGDSRR